MVILDTYGIIGLGFDLFRYVWSYYELLTISGLIKKEIIDRKAKAAMG